MGGFGESPAQIAIAVFTVALSLLFAVRKALGRYTAAIGSKVTDLGKPADIADFQHNRKKVFLVAKSETTLPARMTKQLDESLNKMKTDHVDLLLIHAVSSVKYQLDQDVKSWAEGAKAKGKIRFFGFSTHRNMEKELTEAAKLGWIDGIMTTYNYRYMNTDSMKRAVEACVKAGIGLTAMKTQAKEMGKAWDVGESETAIKLTERFMEKGYTLEQAKLKAVWKLP